MFIFPLLNTPSIIQYHDLWFSLAAYHVAKVGILSQHLIIDSSTSWTIVGTIIMASQAMTNAPSIPTRTHNPPYTIPLTMKPSTIHRIVSSNYDLSYLAKLGSLLKDASWSVCLFSAACLCYRRCFCMLSVALWGYRRSLWLFKLFPSRIDQFAFLRFLFQCYTIVFLSLPMSVLIEEWLGLFF
jgi:hypothetical protein